MQYRKEYEFWPGPNGLLDKIGDEDVVMDVSRYVGTEELRFEVEFVTPAFLGGADGNAEIRTAPFKHGIRYWWRILYGARYAKSGNLKETEDKIFGSTEGKSSIAIYIPTVRGAAVVEKGGFPNGRRVAVSHSGSSLTINILDYLAYGKFDYQKGVGNVYNVSHVKPATKIELFIRIKDVGHTAEIKDAIKMFLSYGGVGSRSRNGFGSMACMTSMAYSHRTDISPVPMDFPCFSSVSRFYRMKKYAETWEEALSEIGEIYKDARNALERPHCYERRGFVARPIEVKGEHIPDNIKKGRIPKPFYLGVMKTDNGFVGYILCFPIVFYEKNEQRDYMEVVKDMCQSFETKLKNDTQGFMNRITGAAK